jgi:hypothetical protein
MKSVVMTLPLDISDANHRWGSFKPLLDMESLIIIVASHPRERCQQLENSLYIRERAF